MSLVQLHPYRFVVSSEVAVVQAWGVYQACVDPTREEVWPPFLGRALPFLDLALLSQVWPLLETLLGEVAAACVRRCPATRIERSISSVILISNCSVTAISCLPCFVLMGDFDWAVSAI